MVPPASGGGLGYPLIQLQTVGFNEDLLLPPVDGEDVTNHRQHGATPANTDFGQVLAGHLVVCQDLRDRDNIDGGATSDRWFDHRESCTCSQMYTDESVFDLATLAKKVRLSNSKIVICSGREHSRRAVKVLPAPVSCTACCME